jgi:transcriptional regulator with XRE-family HTH domain
MATRERGNDKGPTGEALGENVRRIRADRRLSLPELAQRVEATGRSIPAESLRRIELGYRKVDVDDLVALAVALDVSPLALLFPATRRPDERVEATGFTPTDGDAGDLWLWAVGDRSFQSDAHDEEDLHSEIWSFRGRSLPWWLEVSTDVPSREAVNSMERMSKGARHGEHPEEA